ncbi:phosphatase domain-containing putative toxin [Sphingorhabdus sp. Alg231-15]|uniref:phosphatase domain-containing putative toxin n=1 Tax=Sphingorhabdus sp. Alg231-15 TaxID=1922222 RepID=UPI000D5591E7
MKPSIYKINGPTIGSLFQMPKPSGEWLLDDLKFYQSSGMDHIVSLLESEEAAELGLLREQEKCDQIGLQFTSFPIPDRKIPDLDSFKPAVTNLVTKLSQGQSLGIHCRAGIGRSGLLVCCILKSVGLKTDEAIELASQARGLKIPDTQIQMDFIESY